MIVEVLLTDHFILDVTFEVEWVLFAKLVTAGPHQITYDYYRSWIKIGVFKV